MTEEELRLIQSRARDAAELLADTTFRATLDDLRTETLARWRETASGASDLRELYWFEIHALDAIEKRLVQRVEDAEFEAKRAERQPRK